MFGLKYGVIIKANPLEAVSFLDLDFSFLPLDE